MAWYVLNTKLKNELKLAKLLEQEQVEVFCPLVEVTKQWSDRKKKVLEPLFRSYLFVNLDNYIKERNNILILPGAVRFLFWLGQPGIVRDEEIEAINQLLKMQNINKVSVAPILGSHVTLVNGPFAEQKGTIIRIKDNQVTVHLRSIGWKVQIETALNDIVITS